MRQIYFCKDCGFTGSDEMGVNPVCPNCHKHLLMTDIEADRWHSMSDIEKERAKEFWKNSTATSDTEMLYSGPANERQPLNSVMLANLNENIKKMTEDLHFIKTIVAILVIIWILGIACAILFVTGAFRYIL